MGTLVKMKSNKQAIFGEQTVFGEMALFQDNAFFLRFGHYGLFLSEWMNLEFSHRIIIDSYFIRIFLFKRIDLKIDPFLKIRPF